MSARSKARWLAMFVVSALVFTACAGDDDDDDATPSGSDGNGAPATGVTADTIKLGISYPDLEKLKGVLPVDNGPYAAIIKAIVDDVNDRGGVNGRKLEAVIEGYDVLQATAQTDLCTKLTEDEKVFAVLGGLVGENNLCIAQQHETILISGYGSGYNKAITDKAKAPWSTWNASDERALEALVQILKAEGKLEGKKIGIYGAPAGTQPLVDLATDAVEAADFEVTETGINEVPPDDTQAFNDQDQVIGNLFKDKEVDLVIVLGSIPPATNWDNIGFHPEMYSPQTSLVMTGAFTSDYSKFPFVGGLAASGDPDEGYDTPMMKQCRKAYTDATGKEVLPLSEEDPLDRTGYPAMAFICSAVNMFVQAAEAAGDNLTQESWLKGLEGIGEIKLPTAPISSLGPDKLDAQDSFQLMQHDPTWTTSSKEPEFIPVGEPVTLR